MPLDYSTRPHRWQGIAPQRRCATCGMLSTWEGARYSCGGIAEKPDKPATRSPSGRRYDAEVNAARRERREAALGPEAIRAEWRERAKRRRERRAGAELEARR